MIYKIKLRNGQQLEIHNPVDMPDPNHIEEMQEPWIEATILTPDEYLGAVLKLCQDRRGEQKELTYVGNRALVKYNLPLNEVVFDFYDRLKSVSRGYASFDYHLTDYGPPIWSSCRCWSMASRSMRSRCWFIARAPKAAAAPWRRSSKS